MKLMIFIWPPHWLQQSGSISYTRWIIRAQVETEPGLDPPPAAFPAANVDRSNFGWSVTGNGPATRDNPAKLNDASGKFVRAFARRCPPERHPRNDFFHRVADGRGIRL